MHQRMVYSNADLGVANDLFRVTTNRNPGAIFFALAAGPSGSKCSISGFERRDLVANAIQLEA